MWGGDLLLQVRGPKQSSLPVREEHLHGHELLAAIGAYDLAHQASALLYPMALSHLHPHARAYLIRLHGTNAV